MCSRLQKTKVGGRRLGRTCVGLAFGCLFLGHTLVTPLPPLPSGGEPSPGLGAELPHLSDHPSKFHLTEICPPKKEKEK